MSEMVERVAREMRRNRFARTRRSNSFDETAPPTEHELDDARAAIKAMKEPDGYVVEVVCRIIWENTGGPVEAWNAGIDAALKGDSP